jgi:outer membrane protein assembly factor BamB
MKTVGLSLIVLSVLATSSYSADGPSGLFRWENVTDHGKEDYARAVAISGNTAIAAQLVTAPDNGLDFTVKAFDITTGQLQWEDGVVAFPGYVTGVFLTASGDSVFALAYISGAAISSMDFLVRAYKVTGGTILWTHYWDAGRDDFPQGITVSNGRVTIVGYGGNVLPGESIHGLVRTLDASTGAVLWTAVAEDAAWSVSSNNSVVITASSRSVRGRRTDMVLSAYNSQDGKLLWQKVRESSGGIVHVSDNAVFVAVNEMTTSGTKVFIARYDISNGNVLWQSPGMAGFFTSLAVTTSQVLAAGRAGNGLLVQSVDPATGALNWSSQTMPAPGYGDFSAKIAATRNAVYVTGGSTQNFVYSETMLRIYSPTGAVLFDDRSHRVSGTRTSSGFDVAVDGQHLVMVGSAGDTTSDAIVRGYDVSSIEPEFTVDAPRLSSRPMPITQLMRLIRR